MKIFVAISIILLLILLIQNKYKPSLLFAGLTTIYYVFGLIDLKEWSVSYTNDSLLVLVLLLIVSISLEKTVLVDYFSKFVIKKNYKYSLIRLGVVTSFFSAFLNNTAVVASLMSMIKNNKYHTPSKLLIPLSYFAIFGGTMTLIGTSTNLIVNSFVIENGLESLKMFDFLIVGGLITFFCSLTLILISSFLPENKVLQDEVEEHLIEIKVLENCKLIGKSIKDNKLRNLEYLFLLEIQRNKKTITPVSPTEVIEFGDKLIFSGDIKHIEVLKKFDGLAISDGIDIGKLELVDVILSPTSNLIGKKVKESNFRSKFDAAIVSLKRGSLSISKIGEEVLEAGDRLILSVGEDFSQRENITKNFYILSNITQNKKLSNTKSIAVILGFVGAIALSALGVISLLKALLIFLVALLVFQVLNIEDIKRRFPYEIFIIVGSSLAMTKVIVSSGLATSFAGTIINTFGSYGVYGSFIAIFLITFLLTEIITNNAAAALSFPIAYSTAVAMGVSPIPFIFAVAYAASGSFMLPFGYQTNLMVSSLGNYKIKDFLKIGSIISFVYFIVAIITIPMIFKF
jgi:di/tricarboxylate transporter